MATPPTEKKGIIFFGKKKKKNNSKHHPKYSTNSFDGNLSEFLQNDHNNSMIVCESWLHKKGGLNKSWKERYCIAYTDRKLAYFRNITDEEPAGFVYLDKVNKIEMYLPQILSPKLHSKSSSNMSLDEITEFKNEFENSAKKRGRTASITVKRDSLKGDEHPFGFDLITDKRTWTFSCSDWSDCTKWMDTLRDLSFGKALYKGYLRKTGGSIKTWHKRYFIIYDNNEIRYFESDTLAKQKGKIELGTVTKINASHSKQYHYPYCIELTTPKRVWVLAADTTKIRDVWMNGIQNTMKQNRRTFVPSTTGFLSLYNKKTGHWIKYFFAVHKNKTENRLCCFENQIQCKQLEAITCYGSAQFDSVCADKMKQIISLNGLTDVIPIGSFEFKISNENCKQDMSDKKFLFHLKLQNDDYYFAPHPSKEENVQKWVNVIKNLRSSERQNTFSKLVKIGYKSRYIGAALEQYENAYGTKNYRFDEIKAMIDRMAKPETGSTTDSSQGSKSGSSPIANAMDAQFAAGADLRILSEEKSLHIEPQNDEKNNNNIKNKPRRISASYNKILNENDYKHWSVDDVIIWFRNMENGLIKKKYPSVLGKLRKSCIDGKKLAQFNETTLQFLGIDDDIIRGLVKEAVTSLQHKK